MKTIANELSVEYELRGPPGAPAVTFCHALAANMTMWDPQLAVLQSRYRVLCYDVRGHGLSQVPPGIYSFAEMVEDVRSLLDALDIHRTHFVGLSMGGMIGQWFALTHPERLVSLAVCDTSARTAPESGSMWDERIATAAKEGMEPHVEPTIQRWFTPAFIETRPDIVDPVRTMIRTTDPGGYIGCAAAVKTHDALDRLGEIACPTLVIVGAEDPGAPVDAAEIIHRHIGGSQLVVLEPASHLSNLEQAGAFNQALLSFITR